MAKEERRVGARTGRLCRLTNLSHFVPFCLIQLGIVLCEMSRGNENGTDRVCPMGPAQHGCSGVSGEGYKRDGDGKRAACHGPDPGREALPNSHNSLVYVRRILALWDL